MTFYYKLHLCSVQYHRMRSNFQSDDQRISISAFQNMARVGLWKTDAFSGRLQCYHAHTDKADLLKIVAYGVELENDQSHECAWQPVHAAGCG